MSLTSPPSRRRKRAEAGPERSHDLLFYGTAALVLAGIVHVGSVLLLPRNSEADAYARIRALSHGTLLQTVIGPPGASGAIPFADPAMSTAYCLYDLAEGPARISINVAEADFLTVSMHGRHGRAFYALTNRSASHGSVALTLMTAEQIAAAERRNGEQDGMADLRVLAPETKGFVAVQALAAAPSAIAAAETSARKLLCKGDTRG